MARLKARKGLLILFALVLVTSLAIMALPMAGTVEAATPIYVDGVSGNDANDGETPGAAVKTIKKGIDLVDGGGTVHVAAGTYDEFITIGKGIILLGAQAGVDPRDGRTGDESTITSTGSSVTVKATDITIDGFSFTGGTKVIDTDGGVDNLTVVNNIFTGFSEAAMFLNNNAQSAVISKNVFDNSGSPATTCLHIDGSDVFDDIRITDNVFENNDGYGIFAGNKAFNSRGAEISGNLFTNLETGMNLSSQFSESIIKGNTFENIEYTGMQLNLEDSQIKDNTFRNIGPSPHVGYPSYSMMIFGTVYDLAPSIDVVVTGNTFQYDNIPAPNEMENGFRIISAQDATEIHVHCNNFFVGGGAQPGALAFNNQGTGFVNATDNWWGNASGPSGAGPGTGGAVSPNVTYDPWLPMEFQYCPVCGGTPPIPPPPVGGEAYPVNKASLLAPWIAVVVLLAGGISWLALRRRRAQS